MVGFPTSGWVSNQWVEIHPWWVNFQPFTLVGLGAVVSPVPALYATLPEGTFNSFGSEIRNNIVIEINTTVVMVRKTLEINPIVINDLIRRNSSCRCCLSSPSSIQSASSLASEISEMLPIKCLSS